MCDGDREIEAKVESEEIESRKKRKRRVSRSMVFDNQKNMLLLQLG